MNQRQVKRTRTVGKILFVLYIFFLLYFLIFSDWYGRSGIGEEYRCNLVLFKEIRRFVEYRETLGLFAVFTNLFGNILIFVPYGFFISVASRMRGFLMTLFYSFGLSLGVEVFQLLTRVGSFDVDDLLLNTIGGILGYVLFLICNGIRRKYDGRRKKGKKENKEKKEKKEKIRQARQGKSSCMYAIFSLFVLVLLILHAYTMREKTADITGALGLIDMMFTVFGIRAGLKGRQEPEKRHFTCWLGIVLNGLVLLVLIMIFLGGLS